MNPWKAPSLGSRDLLPDDSEPLKNAPWEDGEEISPEDFSLPQQLPDQQHWNLTSSKLHMVLNHQGSIADHFRSVLCSSRRMPFHPGSGFESTSQKGSPWPPETVTGKYWGTLEVKATPSWFRVPIIFWCSKWRKLVRAFLRFLRFVRTPGWAFPSSCFNTAPEILRGPSCYLHDSRWLYKLLVSYIKTSNTAFLFLIHKQANSKFMYKGRGPRLAIISWKRLKQEESFYSTLNLTRYLE